MAGEGIGTSIYMEALMKIYHHSPTHGPTEHREYKGNNDLSLLLDMERLQQSRLTGTYKALDTMLAKPNYSPISYSPKGTMSYSPKGKGCSTYH